MPNLSLIILQISFSNTGRSSIDNSYNTETGRQNTIGGLTSLDQPPPIRPGIIQPIMNRRKRSAQYQVLFAPEVLWSLKRVLRKSLDKESSNRRNSMAPVKTGKLSVLT